MWKYTKLKNAKIMKIIQKKKRSEINIATLILATTTITTLNIATNTIITTTTTTTITQQGSKIR